MKLVLSLPVMMELVSSGISKETIIHMFKQNGYSSQAAALMYNRAAIRQKLISIPTKKGARHADDIARRN